jgi:tRNA (guanosine-2'-O-)-methyltransferase
MYTAELISYLEGFVSERRSALFDLVAAKRSRYLTVVLEDIYQSQNASAVLRTCDCFGIQDVHIIENSNEYLINPDVALGSDKWLNLYKYNSLENNTKEAYSRLKDLGYRIVATTPHDGDVMLDDFDLSKGKAAFVFGTELRGLSNLAIDEADEYLKIPMYGFTESFNISVSAAIILSNLTTRLYKSDIEWELSDEEKLELKLQWLRKTIKSSAQLERQFLSRNK